MPTTPAEADPYLTRDGAPSRLRPRREPVLHDRRGTETPGPLTPAQLAALDTQGFLVIEGWLEPSHVEACRDDLATLRAREARSARPDVVLEPRSAEVRSIFDVHRRDGALAALARSERLAAVARQVLADDVYVHQSRVNYKPGLEGRGFYWHSDFETWHAEDGMPAMRAISASLLLTDNVAVNGPLLLIPGSHRHFVSTPTPTPPDHYKQSLREQRVGTPPAPAVAELAGRGGVVPALGAAGTLVLFDCNTLHASSDNLSPWPRSNLFVVFNAASNRLVAPFAAEAPRPSFLGAR